MRSVMGKLVIKAKSGDREVFTYHGVEIEKKNNNFYIKSPRNGSTRIFIDMKCAKNYIDNWEAIEINAQELLANNSW